MLLLGIIIGMLTGLFLARFVIKKSMDKSLNNLDLFVNSFNRKGSNDEKKY